MIEIQAPIERAILVGAPRKGSPDAQNVTEHLDELARLADTAGADVVGRLTQQVPSPHPATLIGEGKVEELRALVEERGATLVIFDEELSPVQGANLERELSRRVMDRAELILDIFSTRARSHEAKLQVELAQLEYLLPRLTRLLLSGETGLDRDLSHWVVDGAYHGSHIWGDVVLSTEWNGYHLVADVP